jgi:hypothetical protein
LEGAPAKESNADVAREVEWGFTLRRQLSACGNGGTEQTPAFGQVILGQGRGMVQIPWLCCWLWVIVGTHTVMSRFEPRVRTCVHPEFFLQHIPEKKGKTVLLDYILGFLEASGDENTMVKIIYRCRIGDCHVGHSNSLHRASPNNPRTHFYHHFKD